MFRSEEMSYYQLIMPRESAWTIMDELGYLGKVEIVDYDPTIPLIARPFANYIKRCDDLLYKLDQVIESSKKLNIPYKTKKVNLSQLKQNHSHQQLNKLEEVINTKATSILEHKRNHDQMNEQSLLLQDQLDILEECRIYLGDDFLNLRESKINYMIGTIKEEEQFQFQRMIFRVTKGNAFVHLKAKEGKTIYIIMYPDSGQIMKAKIQKAQISMALQIFQLPLNMKEFEKVVADITKKKNDINQLAALTDAQLRASYLELFSVVDGVVQIDYFIKYIEKEKELYIQLNKLKMKGNLFIGEVWIPKKDANKLNEALYLVKEKHPDLPGCQISLKIPTSLPPTFFQLNQFSQVFQQIVNTYGIPRYREINPSLFTIITFPFLFGIMFGDIGHGFCLMMFGLYNIYYKIETFYEFRYLILLMGIFSFYCGLIYNDFVSFSLNIFGSCYLINGQPTIIPQCVYPFGIDPAWGDNLEFGDSYKMKLSVIIAFFHMFLGICLSGANLIFKKDIFGFCCKFLPQIIFLTCTIGYMDFLIIYKWVNYYEPSQAPSIINTMITMILSFGSVEQPSMWNASLQESIQFYLVLFSLISIPWLWLSHIIKGYTIYKKTKNTKVDVTQSIEGSQNIEMQLQNIILDETLSSSSEKSLLQNNDFINLNPDEEFSELVVHETIETIEFVLGVISNTASYLRLWALSLAHSQLAYVFYSLILSESIGDGSIIGSLLTYPIWGLVTFGVLMCMDTMECFLHSLRLHWVEFQNKFFKGDGVEFHVYQL